MLVFIDESGDPGMEFERGSSALFVVTAVTFQAEEDAIACSEKLNSLRRQAGLRDHVELRFSKSSDKVRESVLQGVAAANFFYRSVVINKKALASQVRPGKDSFYEYAVTLTLELWRPHLAGASVDIDKSGGDGFSRRVCRFIAKHFKGNDGKPLLKRVRAVKSSSSNLIQLADMICGAMARSYDEKGKFPQRFRNFVKGRELEVSVMP